MHYVKASIRYALSNPQDEQKNRYLDANEGLIDTTPLDIPKPIPESHPLTRDCSTKEILIAMQNDVLTLEKSEYSKLVTESKGRPSPPMKVLDEVSRAPPRLPPLEEVKQYPESVVRSPRRPKDTLQDAESGGQLLLGTYVKNTQAKETAEPTSSFLKRTGSIPSVKIREKPTKRHERELMMFKEIFVNPKETKLEQLHQKEREEIQEANLLGKTKQLQELVPRGNLKSSTIKKSTKEDKELNDMLAEPDLFLDGGKESENDELVDVVMRIFNSNINKFSKAGESFFSQQIQVQPPEGLNSTVAAPLTPGGGWAPSIPSLAGSVTKASFKDLNIRAKAGVQAGDIQKESHMSFCLGVMNEDKKKYLEAVKFFKRFFFCARLLDDPVGAGLALNRLGVVYHKAKRHDKSLQFHKKHKEFADKENVFASHYNIGITQRLLGNFDESIKSFNDALDWAIQRMDYESECVTLGQMGLTHLSTKNLELALSHFKGCFDICQKMKNNRLQLDCLLCLGYLSFTLENDQDTKTYFELAHKCAKLLKEHELADQCLCNIGIAMARPKFTMHKSMLSSFFEGV